MLPLDILTPGEVSYGASQLERAVVAPGTRGPTGTWLP